MTDDGGGDAETLLETIAAAADCTGDADGGDVVFPVITLENVFEVLCSRFGDKFCVCVVLGLAGGDGFGSFKADALSLGGFFFFLLSLFVNQLNKLVCFFLSLVGVLFLDFMTDRND